MAAASSSTAGRGLRVTDATLVRRRLRRCTAGSTLGLRPMATNLDRNGSARQWKAGIYARVQSKDERWVGGIYTRISRDEEQERLGVQRQEEDGRTALGRRDIPIHRVYEDNDISGSGEEERPDFEGLIADLRDGTINCIWSWDVD